MLREGTCGVLLGLLKGFELVFGGAVSLAFFVQHICQLARFQAMRFKKRVAVFDQAFFLRQRPACGS